MTRIPSSKSAKSALREAAREPDSIQIVGAREHNLDVDRLDIPKRKLVVFTGVSGSGKSSLAFDTLYAEGQRRYVETLSSYARQFLGQMERPKVDHLRGLSPTIAIEQKSASGNPRSTVGTITEVYDYLRVLYARAGEQRCPTCGKAVRARSAEEVAREVLTLPEGTKATLLAPLVTHRKGEHKELFAELAQRGFLRVAIDGDVFDLDSLPTLDKNKKHTLEVVIDRVVIKARDRGRIVESVETALREGKGEMRVLQDGGAPLVFSEARACCGKSFPELTPQSFSFNSPLGMCPACNGLGTRAEVVPGLVVPDESLSIRGGAIAPWAASMARGEGWTFRIIDAVARACKVNLDTPWKKLGKAKQELVLHGLEGKKVAVSWGKEGSTSHGTWDMKFEGVIPNLVRLFHDTSSDAMREQYRKFFRDQACDACDAKRLRVESLNVFVDGKSISDVTRSTVKESHSHFMAIKLSPSQKTICAGALIEITSRLRFLLDVGLEYLSLERGAQSLSGGEAQRIRLASQLGSELSGVMYVLDEPSIGLHPRDNQRLIATLRHLRDLGNTVVVVEHDEETVRAADHVVDFGPGAGHLGGKVIYSGTPEGLEECRESLTGAYLSGRVRIPTPTERRAPRAFLTVEGATEHNLKDVDVKIPLGVFTAVTGVSGAGKSSLVSGILLPACANALNRAEGEVGAHRALTGLEALDKVIAIDQKAIGRTPRSNPGTYTKAFDIIREAFAQLPDSRARGFDAGRFSFNVKGGRCEACKGDGVVKVEMHFLADVYVPCDICQGKRYNAQTLEVRYRDKSIADILDTSVDECLELWKAHTPLRRILETLVEVGLGYMKIGQPATTLSGGEAQRVKLSRELAKSQTGRTLYVLDEPTTGLHFEDIRKLLIVLRKLVESGNSVVVIEHNTDVIRCADWIVDMGPEGGNGGGRVIAEGTPEQVAKVKASYTGQFLAPMLKAARALPPGKATERRRPTAP